MKLPRLSKLRNPDTEPDFLVIYRSTAKLATGHRPGESLPVFHELLQLPVGLLGPTRVESESLVIPIIAPSV